MIESEWGNTFNENASNDMLKKKSRTDKAGSHKELCRGRDWEWYKIH